MTPLILACSRTQPGPQSDTSSYFQCEQKYTFKFETNTFSLPHVCAEQWAGVSARQKTQKFSLVFFLLFLELVSRTKQVFFGNCFILIFGCAAA